MSCQMARIWGVVLILGQWGIRFVQCNLHTNWGTQENIWFRIAKLNWHIIWVEVIIANESMYGSKWMNIERIWPLLSWQLPKTIRQSNQPNSAKMVWNTHLFSHIIEVLSFYCFSKSIQAGNDEAIVLCLHYINIETINLTIPQGHNQCHWSGFVEHSQRSYIKYKWSKIWRLW